MGKTYLGNAFSLQMLNTSARTTIEVVPVTTDEVAVADFQSCIGHADTAAVVSGLLGKPVEPNRVSVKLTAGDVLYVAQVVGGRLPEGSTTLPEGFVLQFLRVCLVSD